MKTREEVTNIMKQMMSEFGFQPQGLGDATVLADEGFDTLDLLETIMGVETEFEVELDDIDLLKAGVMKESPYVMVGYDPHPDLTFGRLVDIVMEQLS